MRALDVLRGVAIAGMVLTNTAGGAVPGFRHAAWNGCTAADVVFPLFLFVMGASMAVSMPDPGAVPLTKVARRAAILFGLGLFLNAFPHVGDVSDLHVMGVLQRIGLCYLLTFLVLRRTTSVGRVITVVACTLVAYWAVLTLVPPPGLAHAALTKDGTIASWLDRTIIGRRRVYGNGPLDPEGLLSTVTATCTVLLGWLAGRGVREPRRLATWGAVGALAGLVWHPFFPMNKWLWTSSFVLFTAGIGALLLAWCTRARRVHAIEVLGRNAIVVFVLSELADEFFAELHVGHSLAFALVLLAGLTAFTEVLWRRRRFVKL